MSFAFASCNEYGIVISADHCITSTLSQGQQYTATSTGKKLFLTPQGYGITYTGCASVDGVPTPVIIQRTLSELDADMTLLDLFQQFTDKMAALLKENIIFIAAGYQDGEQYVFSSSTQDPKVTRFAATCFSGESTLGKALLDLLPIPYSDLTLQDHINLHRFITSTIAGLQSFSQQIPTVSADCDILVIGPEGVLFSDFSQLH